MSVTIDAVLDPSTQGSCSIGLDLSLTGTGVAALDLITGILTTAVHTSPAPACDTLSAHANRHRALIDGITAQVIAANPAIVVVEDLQFSVREKDSSLTRRGFLWWAVVEQLCAAGIPVTAVAPQLIKQFAAGKGNCNKNEVVAAYATAWPEAARGANIADRADATWAAAIGTAWLRCDVLPFRITAVRRKVLANLTKPNTPARHVGDPRFGVAA